MRFLFDQNLSYRLVAKLSDCYPDCKQVRELGLTNAFDYKSNIRFIEKKQNADIRLLLSTRTDKQSVFYYWLTFKELSLFTPISTPPPD